jgi:hypothetical protein
MIYVIIGDKTWKARNLSPKEVVEEMMKTWPGESNYYIPIHSSNDRIGNITIPDLAVIDVWRKTACWEKPGEKTTEKEHFLSAIINELKKIKK